LQSFGGAGGYRGRRTVTDFLKLVAIFLAALVVLLLVGLYFAQEYLVYTDDGLRVELPRLELPFFSSDDGGEDTPLGDITVVEQLGEPEDDSDVAQDGMLTVALQLPVSELKSGTALQQLEQAGANTLVVEMRGQSGQLEWYSQQALAEATHVNGSDESVNDLFRQWNGGDVYTVALVTCFRDDTMPYFRNSMALRSTYGNWRDELGLRWLDPANEDIRAYLADLCAELAAMGFDEILLDCSAYPVQGKLESITTQFPSDREGSMEAFFTQVRQAVQSYGTLVSVRVDGASMEQGTDSGLTADVLNNSVDRVWVEEDVTVPTSLQTNKLVYIGSTLTNNSQVSQAKLEEDSN
jgi:hypothetical protein